MTTNLPRLTVHWLDRSRAQRILWLLEELSLPYNLVTYRRQPDQQAPPSLKQIHPLGKSPVLEIAKEGWKKNLVLAESGFIIEYVAKHFGPHLIPKDYPDGSEKEVEKGVGEESSEWMRWKFLMGYSEGSLMNLIGTGALKDSIKNAPVPFFLKPITGRIAGMIETSYLDHNYASHLQFLEAELADSQASEGGFICGSRLTTADFMMCFPLEAAQQIAGLTEGKYPLLTAYVRRMQGREAYQKAIARIVKETGSYQAGI